MRSAGPQLGTTAPMVSKNTSAAERFRFGKLLIPLPKTEFSHFPIVLFLFFEQIDAMFLRRFSTGLIICCISLGVQAKPAKDRVDLYYGMAEGNYLVGDLRGAERGINQMLRIAPDHVPALTLKARVRLDQKKPDEALQVAERAIELEPENPEHRDRKSVV
jgi:tetratricopeptide (TPR) repeat protein